MSKAIEDVLAERQRQVDVEGYLFEHDDEHEGGEIAEAAAAMALASSNCTTAFNLWPWGLESFKVKGYRDNLVRAGALIIAELERLDRAEQ